VALSSTWNERPDLNPYVCKFCAKNCKNAGGLKQHINLKHPSPRGSCITTFAQPMHHISFKPKFPIPFWVRLGVIGVAFIAIFQLNGKTVFEKYVFDSSQDSKMK
jgi:hypothetical protein